MMNRDYPSISSYIIIYPLLTPRLNPTNITGTTSARFALEDHLDLEFLGNSAGFRALRFGGSVPWHMLLLLPGKGTCSTKTW